MLGCACANTLKDGMKNENMRGKLDVAPMKDKMKKNHLRWFIHVQRSL